MSAPLRVLFAGTPETAVPVLRALLASHHTVVGVLTRPDAPVGRRRVLTPSPVAAAAEEAGLPVIRADRLRGPAGEPAIDRIRALDADVAVVVAYGALVPADALDIPRHGWLNLHFSHLPAYRGAAPVQRAVMDGVAETGADVFQLEEGLDTGPVFARLTRPVGPADTAGELLADLAERGGPLVLQVLDALADGTALATPQEGEPGHAPKLTAADGLVDAAQPAVRVAARINGVTPEPGAWGWLGAAPAAAASGASADGSARSAAESDQDAVPEPVRFKLAGVSPVEEGHADWPAELTPLAPGRLATAGSAAWLRTAGGAVRLTTVQPAGRRMMPALDWARGAGQGLALLAGDALADHLDREARRAEERAAARAAAAQPDAHPTAAQQGERA